MNLSDIAIRVLEIVLSNVTVVVAAVLLWRKSVKMMPREIKGADLNNQITEVSLASQMQDMAKKAAAQVIEYQNQLQGQMNEIEKLREEVEAVSDLRDEVARLRVDVANYRSENEALWEWNQALVKQVRKYEPPVPMPMAKPKKEEK